MFKTMLESLLQTMNALSMSLLSLEGELTAGLRDGIPLIFEFVLKAQDVILPLAYMLLSLFFLLELVRCFQRTEGGGTASIQMVAFTAIKLVCCKLVVDNAPKVMEMIFTLLNQLTKGLSEVFGEMAPVAMLGDLDNSYFMGLTMGQNLSICVFALAAVAILGYVWVKSRLLIYMRLLDAYMMVVLAPLPLATMCSSEWSQTGKNYLRSFASLALQGALIYLTFAVFSLLLGGISFALGNLTAIPGTGGITAILFRVILQCILLMKMMSNLEKKSNRLTGAPG